VYLAEPDVFDDGPVKPVRIWSRVGRRPVVAGVVSIRRDWATVFDDATATAAPGR
jgi:hypothetical protein